MFFPTSERITQAYIITVCGLLAIDSCQLRRDQFIYWPLSRMEKMDIRIWRHRKCDKNKLIKEGR